MGVNSHQMSIVWCLTRKGTNNYRRNGADEMVDRIDEMLLADRIVDEMADRIDC